MENINLSQYINKSNGDPISATTWNEVFGTIQTKINELVYAYNNLIPQPVTKSSLYVNEVLHEETGILTLSSGTSYTLRGKYYGQIVFDAETSKPTTDTIVKLQGLTVISDSNYAIQYKTPTENTGYKDLIITLEKDSQNFIICNKTEAAASDQPGAIYSMNNLRVQGVGYLACYNKGGHGIRGSEVLIAGPHIYFDVEHDGVHGKKVAVDDGYFYFYNAVDGFGTGENGHIEWYHGTINNESDLKGSMFDSKQTGIMMENPGYTGLSTFISTLSAGTAVGYITEADYKADTNGQPLIVENETIIPATGFTATYENVGESVLQTASVTDDFDNTISNVWCFNSVGSSVLSTGRITYNGNTTTQKTFNVYCGIISGPDNDLQITLSRSNVPLEEIFDVFSDNESTYIDNFSGHYITLSDDSADPTSYFTVQARTSVTYNYVKYARLAGRQIYKFNVPADFNVSSSSDLDITLANTYVPGIYFEPESDRIKIKAAKDTINAIINTTQGEDAVKSENNISVEVSNNGHLYIKGAEDGLDGGDIKITDTKGSLIVTGCGARGIKGNAIVIGPNATITKGVITEYITDPTSTDYKDLQGVVVVKGNQSSVQLIDPTDETTIKNSGFADIYARQGKKVTKGDFGTTNAELKGVLIVGSIAGTIRIDLGNAVNLYYNDGKVGTLGNEGTLTNDPGKTLEEQQYIPYNN